MTAQTEAEFYEQALSAVGQGNDTLASIHLKNALQRNRVHLPSRILLGRLYLKNGEPAAAEKELRRAIDLEADPNLILEPLGYSLLLLERFDEIQDFEVPIETSRPVRFEWSMIKG
ncbi:MAG: tetratricopeptide repeat protein, partial [Pseudomonadota bacterium]